MDNQRKLLELTVAEFLELLQRNNLDETNLSEQLPKHVYGIKGIAELFHCSIPTANRIKKSGAIKPAIIQIGRKIIVDAPLALILASEKIGGRK